MHMMHKMWSLMDLLSLMIVVACAIVACLRVSIAVDSIGVSRSISDGKTLVSLGGRFELGFFSPGNSNLRYLGIWYKNIPIRTVVWVANREKPINGSSGMLTLNTAGNLVLSQNGTVVWNTTSIKLARNPVAQLLDSGNLVVRNEAEANSEDYMWQSFDYPLDTLISGMKFGWNLKLGQAWRLTSWKSSDDPSPGSLSWGMVLHNYPEFYMMKGQKTLYRLGPWNGRSFSGLTNLGVNPIFDFKYFRSKDEIFYRYSLVNESLISRIVINETTSKYYLYVWVEGEQNWKEYNSLPAENCDTYALCGAYGNCMNTQLQVCQCLKGFSPKLPLEWNSSDWSQGCVRNKPLSCNDRDSDGFVKFEGLKVPDTTQTWLDESIDLEECRVKCLNNCSCMAYANSDISGTGSGCVMWFGDLIDLKQYQSGGQDLYIRMQASELESNPQEPESRSKKNIRIIVSTTVAPAIFVVILLSTYLVCRVLRKNISENILTETEHDNERLANDLDIPLFDLPTIVSATDDFSMRNKIGQGGFGPVYRGLLVNGQEIAVKTLSSSSGQGLTEFVNEVKLIAKLQHRNLVKLLGCCIEGHENMLVYEYMPNGSLDSFIFDDTKGKLLSWPQRFNIIRGIARGLMYLHQDSRLRIIHRDLKASNVLLDENLNPKISDFGMAKTFGGDQTQGNTNRIVGTHGYMAPEYAVDGLFSVKSDAFSFGILLLEVLCGNRNRAYYHTDNTLNLVGQAWKMWKENRAIELIHPNLRVSYVESEVLRCMHVSLLCVQQQPDDRPTMHSVILMLDSEMELVHPKEPGFISKHVSTEVDSTDKSSTNEVTISLINPR